jgi:beta-glucanase (GH16 family)
MKTTKPTTRLLLATLITLLPSVASAAWQLAWSDEFNGTSINTANWGYEIGFIRNNELQYYTSRPENARIESGNLVIECRRENFNGAQYTSASLNTSGKRTFRYGRIEMRARLPYSKGLWPAFWTLGQNINTVGWPACGEIDVMEMIGGGEGFDDKTYGTVHWDNGGHQGNGSSLQLASGIFADAYHIFAIEWDSTNIKWFMDNANFHTVNITASQFSELHNPHYLLLNLAIGGSWPNSVGKTPDATTVLPQKYYIDYVRAYNWVPDTSNLALNKPVTVSSTENASLPGSAAVDGNTSTRWSSAFSDPQWIYVDLQGTYSINRVKLNWEAAYGRSYQIQVSPNASTWTTIYSTTTGDGGIDDLTGLAGVGRYVRMNGTQRGTVYGYSLWEMDVYGTASSAGPVPDGTYKIVARHSGKTLNVLDHGTANGTRVQQWTYTGGNWEQWTITHLGNSQYKIIGVGSGRALDVSGVSTADGAQIHIWDYVGGNNQKWTIAPTSGGYYSVRAVHSGKALDVAGASTADGANVQQWTYGGGNNQQWAFQAP